MKSTVRHKKINGKRVCICDYYGTCSNKAYMEVYPSLLKGKHRKNEKGWNYLCKKHYYQEQKRFKGKLPAVKADIK